MTLEQTPAMLSQLITEVGSIKEMLSKLTEKPVEDQWMDIQQLLDYHPGHPARQTIYGLVWRKKIPVHKRGKDLLFLKSEIDEWLRAGRRKTVEEIQSSSFTSLKKPRRANAKSEIVNA